MDSVQEEEFIPFDFADDYFEPTQEVKSHPSPREEDSRPEFQNVGLLIDIPVPPWVPHDRSYSDDLLVMLHQEIDDYVNYISPSKAEHALRQLTVQRIEAVAHSIWPNALVQVFGSFETQLYLPSR